MAYFSSGVMILFFFSNPPTILSTASKKSCLSTSFLFLRAAVNAASLQTLAMSAPEKRSEEHTSELQSRENLVCRLLLEKKKESIYTNFWQNHNIWRFDL